MIKITLWRTSITVTMVLLAKPTVYIDCAIASINATRLVIPNISYNFETPFFAGPLLSEVTEGDRYASKWMISVFQKAHVPLSTADGEVAQVWYGSRVVWSRQAKNPRGGDTQLHTRYGVECRWSSRCNTCSGVQRLTANRLESL